jgi:hypothetical protein
VEQLPSRKEGRKGEREKKREGGREGLNEIKVAKDKQVRNPDILRPLDMML